MSITIISRAYAAETEGQIGANFGPILEGNVTHATPSPTTNPISTNNSASNTSTPASAASTKVTTHDNQGLLSFELHHANTKSTSNNIAEGELAFVLARPTTKPKLTQETAAIMEKTPIQVREVFYNPIVDISLLVVLFITLASILFYKKR